MDDYGFLYKWLEEMESKDDDPFNQITDVWETKWKTVTKLLFPRKIGLIYVCIRKKIIVIVLDGSLFKKKLYQTERNDNNTLKFT